MVLWYNNSPNTEDVVPCQKLLHYKGQTPDATGGVACDTSLNLYMMGDEDFAKVGDVKRTSG